MRDVELTATFVQHHVDEFLGPADAPSLDDARFPRMHQDVLAEVLGGQAEVDEGGAKVQRTCQLEEHEVMVVVM